MRRIHKHMEDGWREVWTDGSGYDCPPDRGCWVEMPDEIAEFLLKPRQPKPKPEPIRGFSMRTFVVFTTETGGLYKVERATREEYEEGKRSGKWPLASNAYTDGPPKDVRLKMIAFLECKEFHDFVLDETAVPR